MGFRDSTLLALNTQDLSAGTTIPSPVLRWGTPSEPTRCLSVRRSGGVFGRSSPGSALSRDTASLWEWG